MPATVIIGTQWGDEGKGKVVDLLAAGADVVVRFHGGNTAGHTLVVNGEKTILNLVPAGVLHPGRICMLGPGVVIDPEVLVGEIDALRKRGYLAEDRWLRISERAHLIMPYHRAIDRARERLRGAGKIGTTGRGIGPAYEDKMARTGIRVGDLFDETGFREALARSVREKNGYLEAILGEAPLSFDEIHASYTSYRHLLRPFVTDTGAELRAALAAGKRVLLEGAHGTMLDVDHGTYPFVTSSSVVAGAAAAGAGLPPRAIGRVAGLAGAPRRRAISGRAPGECASVRRAPGSARRHPGRAPLRRCATRADDAVRLIPGARAVLARSARSAPPMPPDPRRHPLARAAPRYCSRAGGALGVCRARPSRA